MVGVPLGKMSKIDKSRDREWSTGCLGLGAGDTGMTACAFGASFGHDEIVLRLCGWLYRSVNTVKTTELHTLNE